MGKKLKYETGRGQNFNLRTLKLNAAFTRDIIRSSIERFYKSSTKKVREIFLMLMVATCNKMVGTCVKTFKSRVKTVLSGGIRAKKMKGR